jgi:hypothetical protein
MQIVYSLPVYIVQSVSTLLVSLQKTSCVPTFYGDISWKQGTVVFEVFDSLC